MRQRHESTALAIFRRHAVAQVERLRQACAGAPQLLQTFLEIQVDVALVKGAISASERELLTRIAESLGAGPLELARLEMLLRARRRFAGAGSTSGRDSELARANLLAEEAPDKALGL